jgi:hypothetical protein
MKMKIPLPITGALALSSLVLLGLSGCGKPETSPAQKKATVIEAPALAPQGSFNEVMALLDEGGGMLLYLGTDQLYEKLGQKVDQFRQLMKGSTNSAAGGEEISKGLNYLAMAETLLKRSGLPEVTGLGISGIEIEKGVHRSRMVLHHQPNQGDGYFWSVFGEEAHEPIGLDLMPANTVLASSQDLNLKGIWQVITNEVAALDDKEISEGLNSLPKEFKKATGLDLEAFLKSFGGHFGMALTLDESAKISVPLDGSKPTEIARPDLLLFAKVNDRLLFDRLAALAKDMTGAVVTNLNGLDQVHLGPLYPPVPSLKPVLAFDGENLLIGSSPEVLAAARAVKAGDQPGLATLPAFQRLSGFATTKGNGFSYLDRRLEAEANKIQNRMLGTMPPEALALQKFIEKLSQPNEAYGVFENTDQGWIYTGVGNQDSAGVLLTAAVVAPAALIGGVTLPAVAKAKGRAGRIKCLNNLKQVVLALKIYASDHDDHYPFQIPEAQGGTKEQTRQDARGDDRKPFIHLMKLKNELGSPRILTCPDDPGGKAVRTWSEFEERHVSYQFRSGESVNEVKPAEVIAWCPFHHNVALVDGSVYQMTEQETAARKLGSWKPVRNNR